MNKLLTVLLLGSSLTTIPVYSVKRPPDQGDYSAKRPTSQLINNYDPDDETVSDDETIEEKIGNTEFNVRKIFTDEFIASVLERFKIGVPRTDELLLVDADCDKDGPAFIWKCEKFPEFKDRIDMQKSVAAFLYLGYGALVRENANSLVRKTINYIFATNYDNEGIKGLVWDKLAQLSYNASVDQMKTLKEEICRDREKLYILLCNFIQMHCWREYSRDIYILFRTFNKAFSCLSLKKNKESREALVRIYWDVIKKINKPGNIGGTPYLDFIQEKLGGEISWLFREEVRWGQSLIGSDVSEDVCAFCIFLMCSRIKHLSPDTIEGKIKSLLRQGNISDRYQNILSNPQNFLSFRVRQLIITDPVEYRNTVFPGYMHQYVYEYLLAREDRLFSARTEKISNPIIHVIMTDIFGYTVPKEEKDKVPVTDVLCTIIIPKVMKAYFPEYGNTVECAASSSIIEQKQKVVGETVNQLLQHNRWAKDKTLEEMIMLVILTLENKKVIEDKSYNVILSIIRATITELQKKAPVLVNRALNKKAEEILKLKIEYNKPIVDLLLQKYIREIDSDR